MGREIIFEFHRLGAYVRVAAMDVATQEEVTITGDVKATQDYLKKLARDRLMQVLKKKGLLN